MVGRSGVDIQPQIAPPRSTAVLPSPLITAAELRSLHGAGSPPTLLDVRWALSTGPDRGAYEAGHLPGAVFVDLDAALAGPVGGGERGRHPLPDAEAFTAAMRAAGVSAGRPVVVHDAGGAMAAARGWWLLRYFGHPDVRVLDGGLAAWTADGGELQTGPGAAVPGDFTARPGGMPVLDADGALALARSDGVLLDARAPERFRGETEPLDPVAGHIPGARNRPTTLNLDASGRFADPAALRAQFARLGARPDAGGSSVGVYCGSGITAAHQILALAVAGIPAALYPGSWSEWVADPGRPVATGP